MESTGSDMFRHFDFCGVCKNKINLKLLVETTIENTDVPLAGFICKITGLNLLKIDEFASICSVCIGSFSNTYHLVEMCLHSYEQYLNITKVDQVHVEVTENCLKNHPLEQIAEAIKLVDHKDPDELIDNNFEATVSPEECFDEGSSRNLQNEYVLDESPQIYSCPHCEKSFRRIGYLRRHEQQSHMEKNIFLCHICHAEFSLERNLNEHMKVHSNTTPYGCTYCDQTFGTTGSWAYHAITHTGKNIYPCKLCDNAFLSSRTLRLHAKIHAHKHPYICDVCDSTYDKSTDMLLHRGFHFGVKNYCCTVCGKQYASLARLMSHCRLHLEEKYYVCLLCNKSFSTKHKMTRHAQTHGREKIFNQLANETCRNTTDNAAVDEKIDKQ